MFDWIACLGEERPVADMQVHCPMLPYPAPAEVDVEACLACRHLLASALDRTPELMCTADWTAEDWLKRRL